MAELPEKELDEEEVYNTERGDVRLDWIPLL